MDIDLPSIAKLLDEKLDKQLMSPKILLGHCRLIDESSRLSSAYTDPYYFPFYYHLGNLIQPKNLVLLGLGLGLSASCFLRTCKSVGDLLALQEPKGDVYYSPRMARANIKDVYKKSLNIHYGLITDQKFLNSFESVRWQLVIVDDKVGYDRYMAYLDASWEQMEVGGIVVMDHLTGHEPARKALMDFARAHNREPALLKTRYGLGIIQR